MLPCRSRARHNRCLNLQATGTRGIAPLTDSNYSLRQMRHPSPPPASRNARRTPYDRLRGRLIPPPTSYPAALHDSDSLLLSHGLCQHVSGSRQSGPQIKALYARSPSVESKQFPPQVARFHRFLYTYSRLLPMGWAVIRGCVLNRVNTVFTNAPLIVELQLP